MKKGTQSKGKLYAILQRSRIIIQILSLSLFFFLFLKTDYTGSDSIEYAVNILFRIDPLLALCTMLAAKTLIVLMLPAVIILILSLLSGRSFCGWLCPMGGLLDFFNPVIRSKKTRQLTMFPRFPLLLLIFLLTCAVFGLPLFGYVDPFSILVRGLVQGAYPAFNLVTDSFFTLNYHHAPPAITAVTEPIFSFLQDTILPFEQRYYQLTLVSSLLLGMIFLAERMQKRFFCRNICPLGALLGLFSRIGFMKIRGGDTDCGKCRICAQTCRMGAIGETRKIDPASCTLCMDCMVTCPRQIITLGFSQSTGKTTSAVSLSRRQFITSLSAGAALAPLLATADMRRHSEASLIRPPGALIEQEFLQRCIRCAECIQVCITNGLQPAFLESGLEGIFSPYLLARSGYCEFNCTLCGQVCPTGAISSLELEQKHKAKIGHAWFDKNICLPFAKGIPCIVCEEHCPTSDKAIKFNQVVVTNQQGVSVTVKQPYIVDAHCTGCGICENKCPLPGRPGVYVTNAGEDRDPGNTLPDVARAGEMSYG